jgi:hypothetical protein
MLLRHAHGLCLCVGDGKKHRAPISLVRRLHTPASVSIRQHPSGKKHRAPISLVRRLHTPASVSIR